VYLGGGGGWWGFVWTSGKLIPSLRGPESGGVRHLLSALEESDIVEWGLGKIRGGTTPRMDKGFFVGHTRGERGKNLPRP